MTQYAKCSFSNHWHVDSWQSVSFTDYLMDKYFESAIRDYSVCHIMKDMYSLMTCFAQFFPTLPMSNFCNSLKRETWENVDKNLVTWHRCNLWAHCVHCLVHCALTSPRPRVSSVSKRNYTGFSVVHSGNWPLLSLAAQLLCTPDWLQAGSMFQIVTRCSV